MVTQILIGPQKCDRAHEISNATIIMIIFIIIKLLPLYVLVDCDWILVSLSIRSAESIN
jgi:hypothetical protein